MSGFFDRIRKTLNISGRDIGIFLVSLLLAFSIWFIHNMGLSYTELVRVPVLAQCNIEGHSFRSSNSSIAQARCRTTGYDLMRLKRLSKKGSVVIEFEQRDLHKKGKDTYFVTSSDLNRYSTLIFGESASIETMITDTLMFRFPTENSKKVPVKPIASITYKSQYTAIRDLEITPDSVVIYGEPTHLDNIDQVYTKSFNLNDLKENAHGTVNLEKLKGVRMSHESVEYNIDVARYVEVKATMPVTVRNVPSDRKLIIFPTSIEVQFRCAFPVSVNPSESVSFYVDYNDFAKSQDGKCVPRINKLPDDVFSYSINPQFIDCAESLK